MFELPEFVTLACQLNATVAGKTIRAGHLGNSPHKFVWYNRTPDEFAALTAGKAMGEAYARGRWLFVPLDPGYLLLLGECGGRLLYHEPGRSLPAKYHLWIEFADGSALTAFTQMEGAMELYERGRELERHYVRGMRVTPAEPGFTFGYFNDLIDSVSAAGKRSAKALLTQEQLIPGLGNAISQDILYRAAIHPRHSIAELSHEQRQALYGAIRRVVDEITAAGGRSDETDLYGRPGGYGRLMSSQTAGRPCPACGTTIEKMSYLGGACYFCPTCQK